MVEDSRSRKWQITINNPVEKGFSHEVLVEKLKKIKPLAYYCFSDEIGLQTNTLHTHIFLYATSAIKFSRLLNLFQGGHFEIARGTCEQNRDYVFKLGKWKSSEKEETNIKDSHCEWGEMPVERQGKRNDLVDLYDLIRSGLSDYQILEVSPDYMLQIDRIEKCRQTILNERFKDVFRELYVTYMYGESGQGKTRSVMEKYGYDKVFRVTDYLHPFDSYKGQDVIVFEEFRSSFRLSEMLNYLDGYPLELPCRYSNKIACYTKVYIISNVALYDQYQDIKREYYESWLAFIRRIDDVQLFMNGKVQKMSRDDYMYGFYPVYFEKVPFKSK